MINIPKKHIDLLFSLKAQNHYHSNRTLFDHFLGTYKILSDWKNPQFVCIAGLYHSIYGVQNIHAKDSRFGNRERIKSVIGQQAEELVYLFCSIPRGRYFFKNKQQGLSHPVLSALVEIEVANILEQISFIDHFHCETYTDIIQWISNAEDLMTHQAKIASQLLKNTITCDGN